MKLVCVGNIAFWSTFLLDKNPVLYLNHTFQKQCELSQYEIVTANGRLKMSVPTIKETRKGAYSQVKIDYTSKWQVEQWRSIENAYRKSPFFLYYERKIGEVFRSDHTTLLQFNLALFRILCNCLKVKEFPILNTTVPCCFAKTLFVQNEPYPQVFDNTMKFEENLSILDLIFNLGPEAKDYLVSL